jgi:hypothetical protein
VDLITLQLHIDLYYCTELYTNSIFTMPLLKKLLGKLVIDRRK